MDQSGTCPCPPSRGCFQNKLEAIDMSVASEETEDGSGDTRANLREWVNTYVLNQELGE